MSLAIAATVFAVIFLAELPDKTALASLILGSRYRPSYVFAGVASAFAVHVGDSRVYRVRRSSVLQITEDHTLIAWQLKQGLITPQEAARSPHKNVITRAVGNREYVQVDTRCVPLTPGVRILLCSDGLHGYLHDEDIPAIVGMPGAEAVERFIELANQRGGKDNITAILVEID